MDRDQILARLRDHAPDLRRHGVVRAALFGSVARGEARPDSDIDIDIDIPVEVSRRHSKTLVRLTAPGRPSLVSSTQLAVDRTLYPPSSINSSPPSPGSPRASR